MSAPPSPEQLACAPRADPHPRGRPGRDRLLSRELVLLLAAQTVFGLSFSTFLLLPKYLATELEASARHIGGVTSAFGLSAMVLMPLVGAWVDRSGRVRAAVLGSVLMGLTAFGFLLVEEVGPLIYGLRFAQGAANALEFVAAGALVTDLAPAHRIGQALGLFGLTMLSTNAVAPALAELVAERAGWDPVFLAAALVALVAAVLLARVGERRRRHEDAGPVPGLWQVAATGRTLWFGSVCALMGAAFGTMFTFVQPLALELGRTQVSDFFIGYTVAAIVVRITLGSLGDRMGRRRVAAGSMALYAVPIFLTAVAGPDWLPWLGLVFGAAHGLLFPAFNALVLEPVGADARGKVFALFLASFNAGWALGTLALGWLAELAGYRAVFLVAGAGVALALTLLLSRPEPGLATSQAS